MQHDASVRPSRLHGARQLSDFCLGKQMAASPQVVTSCLARFEGLRQHSMQDGE